LVAQGKYLDNSAEVGEMGRAITAYVYRGIIEKDLLAKILHPMVHKYYSDQNNKLLWDPARAGQMPVEFAHAVSRFGHAMIRPSYQFTNAQTTPFELKQVLNRAPSRNHSALPLDLIWLADWSLCFDLKGNGKVVNSSAKIKLHATRQLATKLPVAKVDQSEFATSGLLFRDFSRASAAGLRSVTSLCENIVHRAGATGFSKASKMLLSESARQQVIKAWVSHRVSGNSKLGYTRHEVAQEIINDPPLLFYILSPLHKSGIPGVISV
jgi:hypothetical protein